VKSRQPYTPVKLTYDGRLVAPGEFLRTKGGSVYLIQSVKPSPSMPGRRYLGCLRWPIEEIPADATVHPLYWYARKKKASRTLADISALNRAQGGDR
jgi:hypothetical protein